MKDETITGQRITYEYANSANLSERERAIRERAADSVEDSLAILAEIQNDRTDANGDIERAPTHAELGTVTELVSDLEKSIALLEAVDTDEVIP